MKVYITRYALTGGITTAEAEPCPGTDGMIKTSSGLFYHGEGIDWHKSIESAVKRAEIVRAKKIEGLKKQLSAIEAIDFSKSIR